MMAGRKDVEFPAKFVKRMKDFSDNGVSFHGAYGHRWFRHFGMDQVSRIVQMLRKNPDDRRCVLQMWDGTIDLGRQGKDIPCNTHIYFTRDGNGALDMTVCCRSNDAIWGAYGANVVHMSFLQECMAGFIGCDVGKYHQISNNFHAYEEVFDKLVNQQGPLWSDCLYSIKSIEPYPIFSASFSMDEWFQDLSICLNAADTYGFRHPFFIQVARPILMAHLYYREHRGIDRYKGALEIIQQCQAADWRYACEGWLLRRMNNHVRARDDGPNHKTE